MVDFAKLTRIKQEAAMAPKVPKGWRKATREDFATPEGKRKLGVRFRVSYYGHPWSKRVYDQNAYTDTASIKACLKRGWVIVEE